MAGIYIHIPFCKQACHYCDFHFSTNLAKKGELVASIARELLLQRDYLQGERIESIYFGGGTPSLLSDKELISILSSIFENYNVLSNAEITIEANPDDLSHNCLEVLKEIGINRLSIGVQSFDPVVLKFLNRAHTEEQAKDCIGHARKIGFNNISIDLIFAIPGQGTRQWENNIALGIALQPEHISSYSLTIEENTVFGNWQRKGRLIATDEDVSATQLETLNKMLTDAKYDHYEVSNFAKPNFYSRHNSSYWMQKKYLGVGPSAHSFDGASRQYNIANNHHYMGALKQDHIPSTIEFLSREDVINDYLLTTLRTSWGTNLIKLKQELQYDILQEYTLYVNNLLERQLATFEDGFLKLTIRGMLMADKIASDLFALK